MSLNVPACQLDFLESKAAVLTLNTLYPPSESRVGFLSNVKDFWNVLTLTHFVFAALMQSQGDSSRQEQRNTQGLTGALYIENPIRQR